MTNTIGAIPEEREKVAETIETKRQLESLISDRAKLREALAEAQQFLRQNGGRIGALKIPGLTGLCFQVDTALSKTNTTKGQSNDTE